MKVSGCGTAGIGWITLVCGRVAGGVLCLKLYQGKLLLLLILRSGVWGKDPEVWSNCNKYECMWHMGYWQGTLFPYCLVILSIHGSYTQRWVCGGWNGEFILQNCIYMLTGYVLLIHDSNCLCFIICDSINLWLILYWADRLLCETGKLKPTYIWSCCALFCMGTLMRSRNCPSAIYTCVLRYW